jgi:nanoRNase/pAp phosphatase (c-di-AMP/oligoRNAs hydrolase)
MPPKIITHKNPDLDAIGFVHSASSFGKAFLLKKRFVIVPKREQKTINEIVNPGKCEMFCGEPVFTP